MEWKNRSVVVLAARNSNRSRTFTTGTVQILLLCKPVHLDNEFKRADNCGASGRALCGALSVVVAPSTIGHWLSS